MSIGPRLWLISIALACAWFCFYLFTVGLVAYAERLDWTYVAPTPAVPEVPCEQMVSRLGTRYGC